MLTRFVSQSRIGAGFAVALLMFATAQADLITASPLLPPDGVYLSPTQVHAMYNGPGLAIILSDIRHYGFSNINRIPQGANELETFDSNVDGLISVNGSPTQPATLVGPVAVLLGNYSSGQTGTFQTEMLQLNLSGNSPFGPVMIRESPTLQTLGQTSVTDIGGGLFRIDSFFDVFTELSIDGGATWMRPSPCGSAGRA